MSYGGNNGSGWTSTTDPQFSSYLNNGGGGYGSGSPGGGGSPSSSTSWSQWFSNLLADIGNSIGSFFGVPFAGSGLQQTHDQAQNNPSGGLPSGSSSWLIGLVVALLVGLLLLRMVERVI